MISIPVKSSANSSNLWILFNLVLSLLINPTTGGGAYMNPFRYSQNSTNENSSGTKVQQTSAEIEYLSSFLRNLHIEKYDEAYAKCNGIDIREISILELQNLFAMKKLTSMELTNCYLRRIYKMNDGLNAVIEVNPDAINLAHRADIERMSTTRDLSPLHGIPVLIKDNIDTKDQMQTTAGSWALYGIRPRTDAEVIVALRKAGAIIIGKANLSEFANFRGTNIPNGWSGRGGQTRNPYNLLEDPEGSSSGSAVAVAANLATVSLGSETDGSLVCPASANGLCTIRSTHGMVSTRGVIPISHNQDVVGPMARTMTDLVILYDAMLPTKTKKKYACDGSYLNCIIQHSPSPKKRLRVGVPRFPFWNTNVINSPQLNFELPLLNAILTAISEYPELDIVDNLISPLDILESTSYRKELTVLLHDFKHDINEYLANDVANTYQIFDDPLISLSQRIASLTDIIQFNIDLPSPEGYNQELLVRAEATDGLQNWTYIQALETNRGAARALLNTLMNEHNLDAIVVPSECRHEGIFVPSLQGSVIMGNSLSAIAGYPAVSIPAGIGLRGVPFGLDFIGKPFTESKLLRIAFIVEQLIRKREAPRFSVV